MVFWFSKGLIETDSELFLHVWEFGESLFDGADPRTPSDTHGPDTRELLEEGVLGRLRTLMILILVNCWKIQFP